MILVIDVCAERLHFYEFVKPVLDIVKDEEVLCTYYLDLNLDDFRHVNIEKFLSLKIDWVTRLVYMQHSHEIDEVAVIVPESIRSELIKIKELCEALEYPNVVIAPLYYAKMLYYDELFFRVIEGNEVYAMGGRYKNDETVSVGFAIYTDALIDALHNN